MHHSEFTIRIITSVLQAVPVSYTHLDVYKRQEIEVAIITRGVQQVDQFESLLNEFATIQQREMRGSYRQPQQTTVEDILTCLLYTSAGIG